MAYVSLILSLFCSKTSSADPATCNQVMKIYRIDAISEKHGAALECDKKGRITKFTGDDGVASSLTYYDDKIEYRFPADGSNSPITTYRLDANGRVMDYGIYDQHFTYKAKVI